MNLQLFLTFVILSNDSINNLVICHFANIKGYKILINIFLCPAHMCCSNLYFLKQYVKCLFVAHS